jgi:hypothetical protein
MPRLCENRKEASTSKHTFAEAAKKLQLYSTLLHQVARCIFYPATGKETVAMEFGIFILMQQRGYHQTSAQAHPSPHFRLCGTGR